MYSDFKFNRTHQRGFALVFTMFALAMIGATVLAFTVTSTQNVKTIPGNVDKKPDMEVPERDKPWGAFRALSYNVAGLPYFLSGSEPRTNSPLISPKLNDYSLVLLQEDWKDPLESGGFFGNLFSKILPDLFYHDEITSEVEHRFQSDPKDHPWGSARSFPNGPALFADGLNRLSHTRFEDVDRKMWRRCYGSIATLVGEKFLNLFGDVFSDLTGQDGIHGGANDCSSVKGFSVSTTKLAPGIWVDVYNFHAEAGGGKQDNASRTDNYKQLASYMKRHSKGRPVILGGDSNLSDLQKTIQEGEKTKDTKAWETFQNETGLSDVCAELECGEEFGEIDKFFFRSSDKVEIKPVKHNFQREKFTRDDGKSLSDHPPLAVTFVWQKK